MGKTKVCITLNSHTLPRYVDSTVQRVFPHSDVAMLLRDPYALNVLCKSVLQCLLQVYEQNKLPRVSRLCFVRSVKDFDLFFLCRKVVSWSF